MVLLSLSDWLGQMEWMEQMFWIVAIAASGILLIVLILTFFGGDFDGDAGGVDADIDADAGIGFQFISFKSLVAFFAIFGWTGVACLDSGFSVGTTLAVSIAAGLLMMFAVSALFYALIKMSDSGTLNLTNAVGKLGEVYLTVPASRGGFGKIQINVQGGLRELQAMTDETNDLSNGAIVEVLNVIDQNILLVKKSSK